ncbi:putative adenylate kinase [Natrialba magadii ATCC 43099]|uniref:Putative adenylate kinase n=1 Tax=Natrialba magadii (strain ATCC 43099 / DSM 3394 / CCM 3739 / CIP 104546 / IAM 13178 / JCM 8861 / NBRC 102185 / NCIMB 2190 / MS3) TaxID=547559 RepID=D3SYT1_NATMM|nr:adenylate kinase family protein [Natrialba magadii]ADD04192.1 putative adenylate kinase [Natrialba magadii ATCC 43099]ELY26597.1 adenylate kinase [Natrialba magadii ATCC 43099]
MRIAVTGTPGTGKTTATELLADRLAREHEGESEADSEDANADGEDIDHGEVEVVHLNDVLAEEGLYTEVDPDRESKVADLDGLAAWLDGHDADTLVVDSHLAHHFDADRVAVLRCAPEELADRLRERGETEGKAAENAESEALDVILSEAVDQHGLESVYEIDTTDREPEAVADELAAVVAGEREPSAGEVDFTEYLL